MKRFTSLLASLAVACLSLTFVGCDEDYEVADTLWGVWEGNMYVENYYNGMSYRSSYSVIQFDLSPNKYDAGTGYWVDYYSNAPWDYFASHIEWVVSDGEIKIYSYEDDSYFYIYDYSLSDHHFSGYIVSEYGEPMKFYLKKTASPDWNDFDWGWGYTIGYSREGVNRSATGTKNQAIDFGEDKPVRSIGEINN